MEARIYPLTLYLDNRQVDFNQSFFCHAPSRLHDWLPGGEALTGCIRLIKVDDFHPGSGLCLAMEDNAGKAVAFIRKLDYPAGHLSVSIIRSGETGSSSGFGKKQLLVIDHSSKSKLPPS